MIFIGIDIAKKSHFASAVNSDGQVLVKPFSFENSKDGFNLFINKFKAFPVNECFIGFESTDHYGDNLINFLFPKGFKIGMINSIQTNSLRNSNIRKTKNDKIDTFLISKCLILGNYTLIQEKDIQIIKLRTLCRFRFDIIQSQTRLKTQLTTCLDLNFPELYNFFKGNIHLNTSYKMLEKYSTPKEISKIRIDTLSKLFHSASRGRYTYEDAEKLKKWLKL